MRTSHECKAIYFFPFVSCVKKFLVGLNGKDVTEFSYPVINHHIDTDNMQHLAELFPWQFWCGPHSK